MTRSSLPLPHRRWAHDPVGHTPMALPLVPPPILRPARRHRGAAAFCRRLAAPGLVPAPGNLTALAQATKMEWAVAARVAALALAQATPLALVPVVAVAPAAVTVLALAQATLPDRVLAISPAEVLGTKSRFGGERRTGRILSPCTCKGRGFFCGPWRPRRKAGGQSRINREYRTR
jgi:hypothetical protein